jgi:large subunit ribosomal protein L19
MTTNIAQIERDLIASSETPDIKAGDTVRVHVRIKEGAKTRIQVFEGTVIALKHGGPRATITVRKISNGIGVERVFPVHAPVVEKIEIKSRHRVRRAKLYYLRNLRGKKARLVEVRSDKPGSK